MSPRLSVIVLLFGFSAARAEEPRAVIERAVKAMGLDPDPARRPAIHMSVEFDGWWKGGKGDFYYQSPRKRRWDITLEDRDNRVTHITIVLDGDKGWAEKDGKLCEGTRTDLYEFCWEAFLLEVFSLPLLFADIESNKYSIEIKDDITMLSTLPQMGLSYGVSFDPKTGLIGFGGMISKSRDRNLGAMFESYKELKQEDGREILRRAGIAPEEVLAYLQKQVVDPEKFRSAQALVRKLGDQQFEEREKASADLRGMGVDAITALRPALKDEDLEIVRRSRECLKRLETHLDEKVTGAAIQQLTVLRSDSGVKVLLGMLPAASVVTHREILAALHVLSHDGSNPDPLLIRARKSRDPVVREVANSVLGLDGGVLMKFPGRRISVSGVKLPTYARIFASHGHVGCLITSVEFFNAIDPKLFTKP